MSTPETSLPTLVMRLRDDSVALAKAEIALARAELGERWLVVRGAIAPALLAVAVLHAGVLAVGAAAVLWMGDALGGRYAVSALSVGLAFLVIAAVAAAVVVRKLRAVTTDARALTVPGRFAVEVLNERSKHG